MTQLRAEHLLARQDAGQTVFSGSYIPPNADGIKVIIVDVVLLVLASIWVALRFYSRHMKKISPRVEDWLILVAFFMAACLCAVSMSSTCSPSLVMERI